MSLFGDVRYGIRMLIKSPGFTAAALASLALGIGANAAIFSLIDAVFLRPLPLEEPSRLVSLYTTDQKNPGFLPTSHPNFEDYRDHNDVFTGMFASSFVQLNLAAEERPERVFAEMVSGNYFTVLGVKPVLGRAFLPEEDRVPGASPVVVLSHGCWSRRFGSDAGLVGRAIKLNGRAFTVVGVAPPGFHGTNVFGGPELWVPMMMYREVFPLAERFSGRRALLFGITARLKPGVAVEQAEAALNTLASRLAREFPLDNEGRGVRLIPLTESSINPAFRGNIVRAGGLLMTVVALVLLIACANVANLLLVRAAGRRKEIAVRVSLGAGHGRLLRQLMTESLILALLGGLLGLLLAVWGRDLLWAFRPPFLADADLDLRIDAHVIGFTLLLSALTGILFGTAPAIQTARPDLVVELREKGGQRSNANRWFTMRNVLVVGQVALSLVSLVGAGLFLRSLQNAQQIDPGFDTRGLLLLSFDVGAQGYSPERAREFYRQVRERAEALPGVRAASLASNVPLIPGGFMRSVFPEGQDPAPGNRGILVLTNIIAPRYFDTTGIPLSAGRSFTEADRGGSLPVVIINETMARRFWPGQEAIGKRFRFFGDEFLHEVVGVARDSKYFSLGEEPQSMAYLALWQNHQRAMTLHVRAGTDAATLLGALRREVQSLDRQLPLTNLLPIEEVIDRSLWAPRMGAWLLTIFGVLALGLAAVGIYGVMAYSVSQRTNEIGIRMALGARPGDVFRLILIQTVGLVVPGMVLGLLVARGLRQVVSGLLFGVEPTDPWTFAATCMVLAAVAVAAGWLPARRATRVDPLLALRDE